MPKDNGEPYDDVKCKCGEPGREDICPYVHNICNTEKECTCCNSCRHQCAMDI